MNKESLSQADFNFIMGVAIAYKKKYPNIDLADLADLVCAGLKSRHDYDTVLFQVAMNLVNLDR